MINKLYEKIVNFFKNNYKFLIVLLIIIIMFYLELPFVIYRSGGTINLEDRITIAKEYQEDGSFSMSYVNAMKGTPAFILLSFILPDWDLIKIDDITSDNNDYDDVMKLGKVYLKEGIDNAKIAAFKEANYSVKVKGIINTVAFISDDAKTNIQIGDELISVNNKNIETTDDIRKILEGLKVGDEVKVKVINNDKERIRKAKIYQDKDGILKLGVAFITSYEYETEIPVDIKMKNNESGSSGGLMMSLAIYNALVTEDISKGLNIVGTGTIDSEGNVGEIGGVKYKVLGANKKGADIFFCPMENLEEAESIKKARDLDLEIVGVRTLKDAINYLESYHN